MAASSADDHLTVGGDADVVVSADPEHAACTSLSDPDHRLLDGRTQCMPLSAPINNTMVCGAHRGPYSIVLPGVDDKHCLRATSGEVAEPAHRATELGRR